MRGLFKTGQSNYRKVYRNSCTVNKCWQKNIYRQLRGVALLQLRQTLVAIIRSRWKVWISWRHRTVTPSVSAVQRVTPFSFHLGLVTYQALQTIQKTIPYDVWEFIISDLLISPVLLNQFNIELSIISVR